MLANLHKTIKPTFFSLDKIPYISSHQKHNVAFKLRHKAAPHPSFTGVSLASPLLQHTDPLILHVPTPAAFIV